MSYCTRGFSAFPRGFWTSDYYAPLDQPSDTAERPHRLLPLQPRLGGHHRRLAGPHDLRVVRRPRRERRLLPYGHGGPTCPRARGSTSGRATATSSGAWARTTPRTTRTSGATACCPRRCCSRSTSSAGPRMPTLPPPARPTWGPSFRSPRTTPRSSSTTTTTAPPTRPTPSTASRPSSSSTRRPGTCRGRTSGRRAPSPWPTGRTATPPRPRLPRSTSATWRFRAPTSSPSCWASSKSVSPQVVPTASGSTATFTLTVSSQKYTVDGVNVTDYMPPNWQYVAGSTTIVRPDKTTLSGASADPTVTGVPATGQTLSWSTGPGRQRGGAEHAPEPGDHDHVHRPDHRGLHRGDSEPEPGDGRRHAHGRGRHPDLHGQELRLRDLRQRRDSRSSRASERRRRSTPGTRSPTRPA